MRDIFPGAVVSLECLGDFHVAKLRFLDAETDAGRVKLSSGIDPPFTGTHWHCMAQEDGFAFASAGHIHGLRYLDGSTQDIVRTVGDTLPPFSGTRWDVRETSPGVVTIMCLGNLTNRDHRFLDGRTQAGSVGLAPSTDPQFSGTKWGTRLLATPSLDVRTHRQQTGSDLTITGRSFTAGDEIRFIAEGIVGIANHAALSLGGVVTAGSDRSFEFSTFVHFRPTQNAFQPVTIRAYDQSGVTATDTTTGFSP